MRWDEEVFGREYDLDVFNIVAVSDFNMGAMENKGLNIFNDKYVLASPETATDMDYANIEAIIAHEYFHNWSGNRVTCRDWFQLCLKEGLTVFRDQEFSSDERSRPVHRIAEVRDPARAAVPRRMPAPSPIRCARRNIARSTTSTPPPSTRRAPRSSACSRRSSATRISGAAWTSTSSAATAPPPRSRISCSAFAEVTGRDLSHFARWYEQSGTPRRRGAGHYDAAAQTYRLDFAQSTPPTPGQPTKEPMVIPVALGLVGEDGACR